MPGLVEGHSHTTEGTFWRYTYVGYFDRTDPEGRVWGGANSIEAAVDRLKAAGEALKDPKQPIAGWGLDPIYYGERRCTRQDLDRASTTRPIGVLHASGHILNVNTKALELAGLLRKGVDHPGIPLGADGLPTGELKGPEAMMPASPHVGFDRDILACDELGLRYFAKLCVRKGVTTAADLASQLPQDAVEMMTRLTGEPDFPVRKTLYRRSTSFAGFEILHAEPGSKRWAEGVRYVMAGAAKGRFSMPVAGIYPMAKIAELQTRLENRGVSGKLLLEIGGEKVGA